MTTSMTTIIVFDVDNTLACGHTGIFTYPRDSINPCCPINPLYPWDLFDRLSHSDWEIHLWSGAGREHARLTSIQLGIHPYITDHHAKPPYPMTTASTIETLGFLPDVIVDNDPTEHPNHPDIHFIHAEDYHGDPRVHPSPVTFTRSHASP